MALDKIEAVKQVGEMLSKQSPPAGLEGEAATSNAGHFQSMMESVSSLKPASFQRVDATAFASEVQRTEKLDSDPIVAAEDLSSQKSGSATDQEGKQKRGSNPEEEIEGVAGSSKTSKGKSKSLIEQVGQANAEVARLSKLTPESLKTQTKEVISQLDQVKTQLSQTQTEIKPSYQTLLQNRLTHIDDNVKIALNKAGVEYAPPPSSANSSKGTSPLQRFIDMVGNSQWQLENLHRTVERLNTPDAQISPANMLALQVKVNQIQQQVELFTGLLNKMLESFKTIMNVQV